MIGVLGSSYPRISSQAYRAVFEEPEHEEVTPPENTRELTEVQIKEVPPQPLNAERTKLVEFVAQLRELDVQGVYSGDGVKDVWGVSPFELPCNIR